MTDLEIQEKEYSLKWGFGVLGFWGFGVWGLGFGVRG